MKELKQLGWFVLAGVLLAAVSGCTKQAAEKAAVQGRWLGFQSGGSEMLTVEFTNNRFTYWDSRSNEIGGGTFKVNAAVNPMQMDLTFERMASSEYVGKVGLAVFELRGNELKIAGAEPGTTVRPTNIDGGEGIQVFTFNRE